LGLFALPAVAQEGPSPGTPAKGTNPDNPTDNPRLITIAAQDCTISEGASVTLEDGDGTRARFVDQSRGIKITATSNQIRIEGPTGDFIGNHATFPTSDTSFDTNGDYAVVSTTGIVCQGEGSAADQQYDDGGATPTDDDATIRNGADTVIPKTIPQKVLPATGGVPLETLWLVGLMVVASALLLRRT
jgi:hypothetical protein